MAVVPENPEQFDSYSAHVSGAAGTALDRGALDFEGRRVLASTMAGLAREPIRVYGGFAHGSDADGGANAVRRAELIADELERLGAGEREWLCLAAPTGSGWANHVLLRSLEAHADGDIACAVAQFGTQRSVDSTKALNVAVESFSELMRSVAGRPALASCKLLIVGESLGAWTICRARELVRAVRPYGVLLIATPGVAWDTERGREAAKAMRQDGINVIAFARRDDPVAAIPGVRLALWPNTRWRGADEARWKPILTALRARTSIDIATQISDPAKIDLTTHDYRSDMPDLAARILGVTDRNQRARVRNEVLRLETEESTWHRVYGPAPYAIWSGYGA